MTKIIKTIFEQNKLHFVNYPLNKWKTLEQMSHVSYVGKRKSKYTASRGV